MGFEVGLWDWPDRDLAKPDRSGATFSIMNGYLEGRLAEEESDVVAAIEALTSWHPEPVALFAFVSAGNPRRSRLRTSQGLLPAGWGP